MIPTDWSAHLLHIIGWHRTWLAVKDFGTIGLDVDMTNISAIEKIRCRILRFEVRIQREHFYKHQLISVSEIAIEDAIKVLSSESGFKNRLIQLKLTYKDVNEIIRVATDGIIPLELEA